MSKRQRLLASCGSLLLVLAGNTIYALAVKLFLLPAGLMTGGTTGIALTVHHLTGCPISAFVLIFNVLMLILGWLLIGRQFALTTIVSSFVYPVALEVFDRLLGNLVLTEDLMLNTVFLGLGIGFSLGIVIRAGASTGGMDIPPLILNRYFRIPVSAGLYFFDFFILLMQAFYNPPEKVLYGILLMVIYTFVLDKLILMGTMKTEIKIVSRKSDEIRDAILYEMDRGVTVLSGEGGHLHNETQVLISVISNRELPRIEKIIRRIDPESFFVISRVSEVRGRGFSMSKEYR